MPHKSKTKRQRGRSKSSIRRFPRLLGGDQAIAFEKLIWNTPQFRPRVRPEKHAIDFTFRIVVQKLPKRYRALDSLLFRFAEESWAEAFRSAYARLHYGDREIEQSISNRLHQVFLTGVGVWLDESWSLKGIPTDTDEKPSKRTELAAFNKEARIKRNQPVPRVALWVARRWHRFFPAAQRLRSRLKDSAGTMKIVDLRREISKVLPYGVFIEALRSVLQNPTAGPVDFFNAAGLPVELVTQAILRLELTKRGFDPRISIKKYLAVGEELLSSLSSLPKPL